MDKNAAASLDALNKKIESLLAKKEEVLKKERDRKARAQEKWKGAFLNELIKGLTSIYGPDYEELMLPEECALNIGELLKAQQAQTDRERPARQEKPEEQVVPDVSENISRKEEMSDE